MEECPNSPNKLHTPVLGDPGTREVVCSQCGIVLPQFDEETQRDIGNEIATHSPVANYEFGNGLGTDPRDWISGLRGPKPGGSLHRINKRLAKGEHTPLQQIQSEENVISPEGSSYLMQSFREEEAGYKRVLREGKILTSNITQHWPGYTPSSEQFKMWGNENARKFTKLVNQKIEELFLSRTENGITLTAELAFMAVRDVMGLPLRKGRTKNGRLRART